MLQTLRKTVNRFSSKWGGDENLIFQIDPPPPFVKLHFEGLGKPKTNWGKTILRPSYLKWH